jgi:hypothetical protein
VTRFLLLAVAAAACSGARSVTPPSVTLPTVRAVDANHGILFAAIDHEHAYIAGIDVAKGLTWSREVNGTVPLELDAWADDHLAVFPLLEPSGGVSLLAVSPSDGRESWRIKVTDAGKFTYAGIRDVGGTFFVILDDDDRADLYLVSRDGKLGNHWSDLHPDQIFFDSRAAVLGDPPRVFTATANEPAQIAAEVGCVLDDNFVGLVDADLTTRLTAVDPTGKQAAVISSPLGEPRTRPTGLLHCGRFRDDTVAVIRDVLSPESASHSAMLFIMDPTGQVVSRVDLAMRHVVVDTSERHRAAQLRPYDGPLPRYLPVLDERGQLAVVDLAARAVVRRGNLAGAGVWTAMRAGTQFLLVRWWSKNATLVSFDGESGTVTAAISFDGELDVPGGFGIVDGHAWFSTVPKGATPANKLGVLVLDVPTLHPTWSQAAPLHDVTDSVRAALDER